MAFILPYAARAGRPFETRSFHPLADRPSTILKLGHKRSHLISRQLDRGCLIVKMVSRQESVARYVSLERTQTVIFAASDINRAGDGGRPRVARP